MPFDSFLISYPISCFLTRPSLPIQNFTDPRPDRDAAANVPLQVGHGEVLQVARLPRGQDGRRRRRGHRVGPTHGRGHGGEAEVLPRIQKGVRNVKFLVDMLYVLHISVIFYNKTILKR